MEYPFVHIIKNIFIEYSGFGYFKDLGFHPGLQVDPKLNIYFVSNRRLEGLEKLTRHSILPTMYVLVKTHKKVE